jgi:hypothetical protein
VRRRLICKFNDQFQRVWFIGYLVLMLALTVVPMMLWLMELIFVVGASKIIGLKNDNIVKVSYNLSIFVTLLYNNILCFQF